MTGDDPVTVVAYSGVHRWISLVRLLLHPPGSIRRGVMVTRPTRVLFIAATEVRIPRSSLCAAVDLAGLIGNQVEVVGRGRVVVTQGTAKHGAWVGSDLAKAFGAAGFAGPEAWARFHWGDAEFPCESRAAIEKWTHTMELPEGWPTN
jgi:hypothetical protein